MYQTIQSQTQHLHLTDIFSKQKSAERKLSLYRLDNILWSLEDLNLKDQTTVPDEVVEQIRAFGIPYEPRISIPDLIELVFTAQERFMNVEPEEVNRVPTLEELEAYFDESRVA
jgi:hypothetical protein